MSLSHTRLLDLQWSSSFRRLSLCSLHRAVRSWCHGEVRNPSPGTPWQGHGRGVEHLGPTMPRDHRCQTWTTFLWLELSLMLIVNVVGHLYDINDQQLYITDNSKIMMIQIVYQWLMILILEYDIHTGVSRNGGTPKWMVYSEHSSWNRWFGSSPISGHLHVRIIGILIHLWNLWWVNI